MSETAARAMWRTCDLKTVAFLIYAGYEVKSVVSDHGRAVFAFDESEARKNAVLGFWNKSQRVEPVAFIACQNQARDMVSEAVKS